MKIKENKGLRKIMRVCKRRYAMLIGYEQNRNFQALTRNLPRIRLPVSVPCVPCVSVTGFITLNITGQTKKIRPYSWFIPVTDRIKIGISWLEPEVSGYPKP